MSYVKWVANTDRHNDWTTVRILADGRTIHMGEPVDLAANEQKSLEAEGVVFEDSSASEAQEFSEQSAGLPVGTDVAAAAPVFANAGPQNQTTQTTKTTETQDEGRTSGAKSDK